MFQIDISAELLFFIFALGCFAGWLLEVIFRSIKKWKPVNPGLLRGPYLPIYGFGVVFLFAVSAMEISVMAKYVLIVITPTVVELVGGLFFVRYYGIKLWDYSQEFLNFKNIICLKFSIYWGLLALVFYKLIFPLLLKTISLINNKLVMILIAVFMITVTTDFLITFKKRIEQSIKWKI